MKKLNRNGFSMIELLVVLLIIGILAAVAAPLFLGNTTKAKISEAVAGLGQIRQAERTYYSQFNSFLPVTSGNGATYFGTGSGNQSSVLGVQIHGNKYFSPESYIVTTTSPAWGGTPATNPPTTTPQDFVIEAKGSLSVALASAGTGDGAANASQVSTYRVQMDNAGQVIYFDGTNWNTY
jgi:prepilin-type N-terminal cleavage/methylation domain-containing protein